ncbi:ATP synthase F1 subunit epsilon [candidate division TA06 bacterium]|nr:ATP synthase F1 subunit epsilon [candidate division TA06 bacterium]
MDEKPFALEILTIERPIFTGEARALSAPGEMGEFGILAEHAHFVSGLKNGTLKITLLEGQEKSIPLHGGFLRVEKNRVVVLADID